MSANPNFVSNVNVTVKTYSMDDLTTFTQPQTDQEAATWYVNQSPRLVTLFTAGPSGSWLRALNVFNYSTRTMRAAVTIKQGADQSILGLVDLPPAFFDADVTHGIKTDAAINLMDPGIFPCMDFAPNRGLRLPPNALVQLQMLPGKDQFYYDTGDNTPVIASLATLKSSYPEVGLTSEPLHNASGEPIGFRLRLNEFTPGYFRFGSGNIYSRDCRITLSDKVLNGITLTTYGSLQETTSSEGRLARSVTGLTTLNMFDTAIERVSTHQLMGNRITISADGVISYDGTPTGQIQIHTFDRPPSRIIYMFPYEVLSVTALGGDF